MAAGGGSGWTSHINKGAVFKVDEAGQIAATYPLGIGSGWMAFADGVLWVGNIDEGTVTGIDGVTGATTHTYRFDHPVGPVAAGDGVLLVSLFPGRTVADRLDSLKGRVAKVFSHAGELGGDEPALNVDPGAYQIEFATCAKLLNYPDKPPPEGLRLAPEIAAAMPTISPDRRTYTFRVRPGYRFSPPSNQPVTAETFRHSIERALSPRLARNPIGQIPPGPLAIDDIEGERAFRAGAAKHISGLRARGDTLSITLVRPSPDFLQRLALPFFCPVPDETPFVAGAARPTKTGDDGRIPFGGPYSAGPYYIADYDSDAGYVVLKRNPNYRGPRPHSLDAIAIREGVDARPRWTSCSGGSGMASRACPTRCSTPGRAVDQRWGAGSPAARRGDRRYFTTPRGTHAVHRLQHQPRDLRQPRGPPGRHFCPRPPRSCRHLGRAADRSAALRRAARVPRPPVVPAPRLGGESQGDSRRAHGPSRDGHSGPLRPMHGDRAPGAARSVRDRHQHQH